MAYCFSLMVVPSKCSSDGRTNIFDTQWEIGCLRNFDILTLHFGCSIKVHQVAEKNIRWHSLRNRLFKEFQVIFWPKIGFQRNYMKIDGYIFQLDMNKLMYYTVPQQFKKPKQSLVSAGSLLTGVLIH